MSTSLTFYKMSGSGNDFILVDNRTHIIKPEAAPELARSLCRRKVSVGADGLILIENDQEVDFSWRFFNADGSSAEMCGNGGRCVARLANMLDICGTSLSFRTRAGIIRAELLGSRVKLQMTTPFDLRLDQELEVNGQRTPSPQVIFYASGETTPAIMSWVDSDSGDLLWELEWDLVGRIELRRRGIPNDDEEQG